MLDIAFTELPRSGIQDLPAGKRGFVQHESQRVLQLVAEAEGAACLVEGGAGHDAAAEALIRQPGVDEIVHPAIRSRYLQPAGEVPPEGAVCLDGLVERSLADIGDDSPRFFFRRRIAEEEGEVALLAGAELDVDSKRRGRITVEFRRAGKTGGGNDGLRRLDRSPPCR